MDISSATPRQFVLRIAAIGQFPEVPITERDYASFQASREVLFHCLAIEEKYEILIANYLELERTIMDVGLFNMVRTQSGYSDFFDARLTFNIHLVNLLTSARLYIDQLAKHVLGCDSSIGEDVVANRFSTEYDSHLEYRFMEALRNHVQHYGIPVHWTSHGSRWTSMKDDGLLEYTVELASMRKYLAEDNRFKANVLSALPDKVDLKAATRRYIESLSSVHHFARDSIRSATERARSTIEAGHARYRAVYDGSLVALEAYAREGTALVEPVPLLLKWDDVRIELQKRNGNLTNLHKRYLTNQLQSQKFK